MFVSQTVMAYLDRCGVDFEIVPHRHTGCSRETARVANVEPRKLAKAVLMHDLDEYLIAAVPASRRVNRWALETLLDDPEITFADESEMPFIFRDCERGAVPVIGPAFGLTTAVDEELLRANDVYFEAGDHEHLVHVGRAAFKRLLLGQPHGHIAY